MSPERERRERVLAGVVRAGAAGISGQALADALGCSRAAVHRHVEALRGEGIAIDSAHDGYRPAPGTDPIAAPLVAPRLTPPIAGPLSWTPATGSTNDDLIALARDGAPEGTVVVAERQSAGRGRRGRSWLAAPGHALLVSALLRPELSPVDAGLAPIVAAVAVADAIGPDARIVWPNDILVAERKLAGILCEMSAEHDRVEWVVVGVGVNVRSAPDLDDARRTPGALSDLGPPPRRADLLVELLAALGRRYAEWTARGAAPIVEAFSARDALAGRRITVALPGETHRTGECTGIDDLGRLRLRDDEGAHALGTGEVIAVSAPL